MGTVMGFRLLAQNFILFGLVTCFDSSWRLVCIQTAYEDNCFA